MKTVKKKLADLRHPDRNVRLHSDKQLQEFRRSIEMFGQIRPIVCDEKGVMLAGNGLYEALTAMGRTEADCYVVEGLSEKEKKKLMLADNKIFSLGVDDTDGFDQLLAEIQDADIPGYDPELLNTLLACADEVDELLGSYGQFSEASQASMQRAASENGQTAEPEDAGQEQTGPARQDEGVQEVQQTRYVVCPNCGTKIPVG